MYQQNNLVSPIDPIENNPDRSKQPASFTPEERPRTDLRLRFWQTFILLSAAVGVGLLIFSLLIRNEIAALNADPATRAAFDQAFVQGFAILLAFYLLTAVIFWLYFTRQIITPLERLERFSSRILWRSSLRRSEQEELAQLTGRTDQVGNIARSLLKMARDTEHHFMQLATLLETSRVVAALLDVPEVMDNILGQLQLLFKIDRAAIVTLDGRAGVFRIRASRGMSSEYVERLRIAPSDPNSPAMRALRLNQPVQVADTETDLSYETRREITRRYGHRSVLAIPLRTRHAPPTVLVLQKTMPYRYSYSELELADSFGNHASVALENAALFSRSDEKLQEQTRRLEAIVEGLNDGLILAGLNGRILFCNRQALTFLNRPRTWVLDRPIGEIVEELLRSSPDAHSLYEAFAADKVTPRETSRYHEFTRQQGGSRQDIRLTIFDVTDARGERIGQGQLWRDITRDRELDRMKSALLSTVSHELRTPLATIKGYATTLLARDVEWDAQTQREFLNTISAETDRMAGLVKDLLDMSRIEANLLEINCQPYTLEEIIEQVAGQFQLDEQKRIHLILSADLPLLMIDRSRIETVIRNLLNNALKYSEDETPILVESYPKNGEVICSISDQGPGVPVHLQDKIFDPFFRADDGFTREVGGVGLGLAICRGFIEAHDGRIWVESARQGRGATFGFSLPATGSGVDLAAWRSFSRANHT